MKTIIKHTINTSTSKWKTSNKIEILKKLANIGVDDTPNVCITGTHIILREEHQLCVSEIQLYYHATDQEKQLITRYDLCI